MPVDSIVTLFSSSPLIKVNRARNDTEIAANSPVILEAKSRRDAVLKNTGKDKEYSFDRVFGPESKQDEIYRAVAQPILDEVLMGFVHECVLAIAIN